MSLVYLQDDEGDGDGDVTLSLSGSAPNAYTKLLASIKVATTIELQQKLVNKKRNAELYFRNNNSV
ncbi:hypothetical protein Tco_0838697, partial [Tanacetum coccineum]